MEKILVLGIAGMDMGGLVNACRLWPSLLGMWQKAGRQHRPALSVLPSRAVLALRVPRLVATASSLGARTRDRPVATAAEERRDL